MSNNEITKDESCQVEIPLPEDRFRRLGVASRPTFFRWEREGLEVLRVGGRRFIYPSELKRFMEKKNTDARAKMNARDSSHRERLRDKDNTGRSVE